MPNSSQSASIKPDVKFEMNNSERQLNVVAIFLSFTIALNKADMVLTYGRSHHGFLICDWQHAHIIVDVHLTLMDFDCKFHPTLFTFRAIQS